METAKDKAKSLVEKYIKELPSEYLHYDEIETLAIECAKIAVDEIIKESPSKRYWDTYDDEQPSAITFWQEVKNELNKM